MKLLQCCRTCLAVLDLNPIFQMKEHHEKYTQVILEATGVKIELQDSLPQQICKSCIEYINTAYQFRKKCQESQRLFSGKIHNHIFNIKVEEPVTQLEPLSSIDINDLIDSHFEVTLVEVKLEIDQQNSDQTSIRKDYKCIDKPDITIKSQENNEPTKEIPIRRDEKEKDITERDKDEMKCEYCHKVFKTKSSLKSHYKIHKLKVVCEIPIKRDEKEKDITERDNNEMKCEYCHKVYKTKTSLQNHYRIHKLKTVCEHCGKKFSAPCRLLMHCKAKHGYEKTDKCSYCDYRGSCLDQVKAHERLHTGEKPYVCAQCGAGFHRSSSYFQHIAIHLPEKTVQCKQCPALFKSATLMRIHANRHREEAQYRYKCVVCAHHFKRRRNAAHHLQRIHSLEPLPERIERTKCFN